MREIKTEALDNIKNNIQNLYQLLIPNTQSKTIMKIVIMIIVII